VGSWLVSSYTQVIGAAQTNCAREQEKKICAASSGTPQRAQTPVEEPWRVAICWLEGSLSKAIYQEIFIFIFKGTFDSHISLKCATVAPKESLAYNDLTKNFPEFSRCQLI
jgi:hypothetical protein